MSVRIVLTGWSTTVTWRVIPRWGDPEMDKNASSSWMSLWVSQLAGRLRAHSFYFWPWIPAWLPQWCSLIWKSKSKPPFPSQARFWSEIFSHINRTKLERADGTGVQAFLLLSSWCYQGNWNSLRSIISVLWWHREGTRVSLGTPLPVMMITPPLTWVELVELGLFFFFCFSLQKTYLLLFAENWYCRTVTCPRKYHWC